MNCRKIRELLTAYLDGEVTPQERANIEAHLPGCPRCRAELEALTAAREELHGVFKAAAEEVNPSPGAWEKIRSQLETGEERKGFWSSLTMTHVATASVAVVILVIAVVIWQFGGFFQLGSPPPTTQPGITAPGTTASTTQPGTTAPKTTVASTTALPPQFIQIEASFDKVNYLPGEEINVAVSFTNITTDSYEIMPFPPAIEVNHIFGENPLVYRSEAGTDTINLEPGATTDYVFSWDQRDQQGQPVPYGQYNFVVPDGGTLEDGKILGSIFILPEEGVIEKTIEVNESQTVGGITFTLERVELTASGPRFFAFNADYVLSLEFDENGHPSFEPPCPSAGYSLDDGAVREEAGVIGVSSGSNLDGLEYMWFMAIPVPQGTGELTFTITEFDGHQGPWEFTIQLN